MIKLNLSFFASKQQALTSIFTIEQGNFPRQLFRNVAPSMAPCLMHGPRWYGAGSVKSMDSHERHTVKPAAKYRFSPKSNLTGSTSRVSVDPWVVRVKCCHDSMCCMMSFKESSDEFNNTNIHRIDVLMFLNYIFKNHIWITFYCKKKEVI